jgi:arylsulfatase/uncharacterized sulfatase
MKPAQALGLVPENSAMEPMASTESWQNLEPETKRYQAKRMEVYAAMVEAMDFHTGRLIQHLRTPAIMKTPFLYSLPIMAARAAVQAWSQLRPITLCSA